MLLDGIAGADDTVAYIYGQSLVKYMSTQNVDEMVSKDMPDKVLTNFLDEFTITE